MSLTAAFPVAAAENELAAEYMAQDMENLTQLSALGQMLYQEDEEQGEIRDHCVISLEFAEQGEFRRALREASKSFFLGKKTKNDYFMAANLRNMAIAYSYANDLVNAERMAKLVIENYFSEGIKVLGMSYKVLGDVRLREGKHAEALDYYQQALDNSPRSMETIIFASMGRVHALMKQFDKARDYYDQATEMIDFTREIAERKKGGMIQTVLKPGPWMEPTLLRGQADLAYLEGNYDKALALLDAVLQSAADDTYQELWTHVGRARILKAKGDAAGALAAIDQAVDMAEHLRAQFRSEEIKIGLFNNMQDVFDEAIDMHMAAGDTAKALHISEKSRARALLDMVRNRVSLSNGTAVFADPSRQVADPQQIQAALPENTAMVVYHSNPAHTFAWVVRKTGIQAVTIDEGRDSLARKIRQMRLLISQRGNIDAYTKSLHQLLIQPLALKKNEQVIFVPHKALHFLPFQALQSPAGYLIEAHRLIQVPSASLLTYAKGSAAEHGQLLAVGNPKLTDAKYDLPGAQAEVEAIAKLYKEPRIFVREQATRSRVTSEAPSSQIIHIAAHAVVDPVDPLYSRILLSPEELEKKDLEAKDIYQLDLHNTSLVVLSACRSGLGNITRGDELIGFTRTFISAGADNVIVSLWDVDDASTSRLMQQFYQALQKTDLASAMQQAQKSLIKDAATRHPFYWAAFNLVGTR
jgi:CHAT domain-containing protein